MKNAKLRELPIFCSGDEKRKELFRTMAIAALDLVSVQIEIALKRLKRELVGVKDEEELTAATHAFAGAREHLLDACPGFAVPPFDENDVFQLLTRRI